MISTASVAGVGYYTGSGEAAATSARHPARRYYTGASEKGEPPGRWSGRLAEQLGLAGDVDAAAMERAVREVRGTGRDADRPAADAVPVDRVADRAGPRAGARRAARADRADQGRGRPIDPVEHGRDGPDVLGPEVRHRRAHRGLAGRARVDSIGRPRSSGPVPVDPRGHRGRDLSSQRRRDGATSSTRVDVPDAGPRQPGTIHWVPRRDLAVAQLLPAHVPRGRPAAARPQRRPEPGPQRRRADPRARHRRPARPAARLLRRRRPRARRTARPTWASPWRCAPTASPGRSSASTTTSWPCSPSAGRPSPRRCSRPSSGPSSASAAS